MAKSRLSEETVRNLKLKFMAGTKPLELAAELSMPKPTVYAILAGRIHKDVEVEGFSYEVKSQGKRMSQEVRSEVIAKLRENVKPLDVAKTLGISANSVYRIRRELANVA